MIKKLYNLKKLQIDQHIQQRQQFLSNISSIDDEIGDTQTSISRATVQSIGAINDFKVLEIHKNTMREHIVKLEHQKTRFLKEVDNQSRIITQLNKEMEQFKYIFEKMEQEKQKKQLKQEEETAAEYVQAKWMAS